MENNNMKTVMQQAIEKVKDYPFLYTEDSIVSILTELLEAEKEQISEAYRNGFKDAQRPFIPMESYTTFEQYYQQTYNQEQ